MSPHQIGSFTKSHLDFLIEHLTEHQILLPYLSAKDQTKLFAIMDSFVQVEQQKRSIDENGARFVCFARLLLSALPVVEGKAVAVSESLSTRDISWAFYSDSQDILADFTNQSFNGKPLWKDVIFDVRQMRHRETFRAHEPIVKSLFVDDSNGLLISGAIGGEIKVRDLEMFGNEGRNADESALSRRGFLGSSEKASGMSTCGVMRISVNDNRIYTCGADGSLSRCQTKCGVGENCRRNKITSKN
ncbi:RAVE protein 1 C terminal-domain-containing protein [Chytriomyces cf. hyalinus JEL632]|nr:RAVE protein 1 C terminal-domain-containing protein [Chytriomyces cf. hyalinus JEL632]